MIRPKILSVSILMAFLLFLNLGFALDVSVSTDKAEYQVGEYVYFDVTVTENGEVTNADITITINGNEITGNKYQTTGKGTFTAIISVNNNESSTEVSFNVVEAAAKQLTAVITNLNDVYYPSDSIDIRVTVTDENGNLVDDASVSGKLNQNGEKKENIYFSQSYLCDCYKGWTWARESYLGVFVVELTITRNGYSDLTITKEFSINKPVLNLGISAEKDVYHADEELLLTITTTDKDGNPVDVYLTGEVRDEQGFLVQQMYPNRNGDIYNYNYWFGENDVGKTYTFTVNGEWLEQEASASTSVSVTRMGLSADVSLEKIILNPGDYIRGKIYVTDQSGNNVRDAWIEARLYDSYGNENMFISAMYENGFYELDPQKIQDWFMSGKYTLEIRINKAGEETIVKKEISVQKEQIGVNVIFDKLSYKPGDKIYLKILLSEPDGTIITDAYVSGEIFPLTTEVRDIDDYGHQSQICRMYMSPEGPIFYKGEFIQKYYVSEIYLDHQCPASRYVLKLRIEKEGYEQMEIEKEFEVTLMNLLLEAGTKVHSYSDSSEINIYGEIRDGDGNMMNDGQIFAYLHPAETEGCVKKTDLWWDHSIGRYTGNQYVERGECPEGSYILELKAEHPSFNPTTITQEFEIRYEDGFEYRELTPSGWGKGVPCETVSCGEGCFEKRCGQPACRIVIDEECVSKCKQNILTIVEGIETVAEEIEGPFDVTLTTPTGNAVAAETTFATGTKVSKVDVEEYQINDLKECLRSCEIEICDAEPSTQDDMSRKLDEIQRDVKETKEITETIRDILQSILDFFVSMFQT